MRRHSRAVVSSAFGLGLACGAFLLSRRALRRRNRFSFQGKVVLITGGSRGLGLVMARELAREGARLALVARKEPELGRARAMLEELGADVFTTTCDAREQDQVNRAVQHVIDHFGRLDVLINNAGVIQVGPLEHMSLEDFEDALAVHLFGPLFFVLAALPHLRRAHIGRIVNISSVGGKIAVPHLLPYSVSKFALTGLSEGLRAELKKDDIRVTTVCPGLMRTGSTRNALFKGRHKAEYAWFTIADSLPLLSMSADTAARRIIEACRQGKARLTLGMHTKAAILLNELFPEAAAGLLSLSNKLLPKAGPPGKTSQWGHESESAWSSNWVTGLTAAAARRNNEVG